MLLKKLFLCAVFAATVCAFLSPAAVRAEETDCGYARITENNVYMYRTADENDGLFILPRTYFVKLTGETGDFYTAEYLTGTGKTAAVRGYCRKTDVTPVDFVPETPFLIYDTEVTFKAGNSDLPNDFFTEYTVPAVFYGTFLYGSSTYYYINIDGKFGYVPASACPPLDYPLNTEHTQTETNEQPKPSGDVNAVNVLLICVLSVAALGAVYFLFRPAKQPRRTDPFGEDYEQLN